MKRAYAVLDIKAVDEQRRTFKGIATTPSTDRMEDIVEPEGAVFKLPLPLLWQHDARDPIGWVTAAKQGPDGIEVEGEIAAIDEDGELKQRLHKAWQMLKTRLVRGLSIGFKPIETADIKGTWGIRFLRWEWLELSAVTVPANQDATITSIKAIDGELLAASGHGQGGGARGDQLPGATGQRTRKGFSLIPKDPAMKTIAEQIAALEAARAAKAARMGEIMQKSADEGRSSNDDEGAEFDELGQQVAQADKDLVRLRQLEKMNIQRAVEVDDQSQRRGPVILRSSRDKDDTFKGQSYTRMVIAKAVARLLDTSPIAVSQQRWGKTNPMLVEVIKAAVAGGGSDSGEWGAELVAADGRFTGDFVEFLTSKTVYDKLPLRPVPANVTIKGQDGTATGYWVGQSKGIPVSKADFNSVNLTPLKVGAIAVVSNELLRDSSPAAEMLVRDSLVDASAQRVDTTFLGAAAASAGVSPAGLLNGVTAINPSGADADAVRNDLIALYQAFLTNKNASGLWLVMQPALGKVLQLMVNTLGQREFPDINAMGGNLLGDPVVTGDNVTNGHLILLKPSDIWRIGDTGVEVSVSREAMIEQDSAPQGASDTPVAASATLMSMYQNESTAIKVVRSINFQKRRTHAVQFVQDVEYGGIVS